MIKKKSKRAPIWSQEELDLLRTSVRTATLMRHPLLQGRTLKAIESKRSRIKIMDEKMGKQPKVQEETLRECSRACLGAGVCDQTCEPDQVEIAA